MQPAARIIAILREPSSFLYSLHLQFVQIYIEPETDMRRALALEDARREGRHLPEHAFWGPQGTLYSDYVRYVEQLERYQALFGDEQMLVLCMTTTARTTRRPFARYSASWESTTPTPSASKSPTPPCGCAHSACTRSCTPSPPATVPCRERCRATAKTFGSRVISRQQALALRNRFLFTGPRQPDRQLMLELRRRFKPEVVALSEHLGRDLVTLWGYDDLG